MDEVSAAADPWTLELFFGRDERLQTAFGPIDVEYVDGAHTSWLRLRSDALLTRDEDGHLTFATFEVSSRFGGSLARGRFADTEAAVFEIAREWALAHTRL